MAKALARITGIAPDPEEGTDTPLLSTSNRKIGVEFELENIIYHIEAGRYPLLRFSTDNSLRNNGIEITTIPVKGTNILLALDQLQKWIKDSNNKPVCSARTGLHVHIDMRDVDIKQLINVLTTYLIVEESLFKYCGEDRKQNPYCSPLSNCIGNFTEYKLADLLSTSDSKILRALDKHIKYSALNLRPLISYGTIEFRMHKGSCDTEEILQWINILLSVVTFGIEYKSSPQDIIDSICTNTDEFIDKVFRGYLPIMKEDLYDDLLYGARQAQHLYRHREVMSEESDSLFATLYNSSSSDDSLEDLLRQIEALQVPREAPQRSRIIPEPPPVTWDTVSATTTRR